MQNAASVPTDQFPELLARLPAGLDLDDPGAGDQSDPAQTQIGDGASLLRLALARGPGGFSLRQTRGLGCRCWEPPNSATPVFIYRLNQAVAFLAALVGLLLAAKHPAPGLRWPGRTLRLADAPASANPGSKGTDWRIHGVFDLGSGGFSHLDTDRQARRWKRGAPLAGEIRIGDRGLRPGAGFATLPDRRRRHGGLHRAGGLECSATEHAQRQTFRSDRVSATPSHRHEAA